jgi:hypothetical protein
MLSQCWNGGGAETFSAEGYVADSVGEKKFRKSVIGFRFGDWDAGLQNGNEARTEGSKNQYGGSWRLDLGIARRG